MYTINGSYETQLAQPEIGNQKLTKNLKWNLVSVIWKTHMHKIVYSIIY